MPLESNYIKKTRCDASGVLTIYISAKRPWNFSEKPTCFQNLEQAVAQVFYPIETHGSFSCFYNPENF